MRLFSSLLILGFFSSCGSDHFFSEIRSIHNSTWILGDTLQYQVFIRDTSKRYDIGLELRHDKEYEFQNLYVQIQTRFPGGKILNQPVSLDMADHRGSWYGDCSRSYCTVKIILQEYARFEQDGEHLFKVSPFMRQDTTRGISELGLFLDEH